MKRYCFNVVVIGLAVVMMSSVYAFAQEEQEMKPRIIEEEIILNDPTVSAEKKWVIGGSYEYWYISGDYDKYDQAGNKVSEGTIDGDMDGGNLLIGYDNWTFQFSYREGEWDTQQDLVNIPASYTTKQEQDETEISLRYLARDFSSTHFVPYLIIAYNMINMDETKTITTPGYVWGRNWTTVIKDEIEYNSALIGAGAIIPFNKYIGIRGDLRVGFTDAERRMDTGTTYSGDGGAIVGHLTGYWNIFRGLNLQVGGKYQYLNGGTNIPDYEKGGMFAMVGYSYKF